MTELTSNNTLARATETSKTPQPAWSAPWFHMLCKLVGAKIRYGVLTLVLPSGGRIVYKGVEELDLHAILIVRDFAFARRTLLGGDIGFFEAYADDQWESPNLADCLTLFARNADYIASAFDAMPLADWIERLRHFANRNTRDGSRRNIAAHYDLGNNFYEKWLDPTMTYSSAKFSSSTDDLSAAQVNKYRALAQSIELKPDESVLEIGCGWGGFAEFAAKDVGAKVTGLTLSKEQLVYAQERIFREGLTERVDFKLVDYRDEDGAYDKIASIEMFEAVGREYWPTYFAQIRERLKPGGVAGLQVITIADRMFEHYLRSIDFIQRYVFPGGALPSPSVLKGQIEKAGLTFRGATTFGQDYAQTLARWHDAFLGAWQDIKPLGFDERFKKLWRFYLAYSEAGFRAATTDVCQVAASKA